MLRSMLNSWEHYRFWGTGPKDRVCVLAVGFGLGDCVCMLPALSELAKKQEVTLYTQQPEVFERLPIRIVRVENNRYHCDCGELLDPEWDEKNLSQYGAIFKFTGDLIWEWPLESFEKETPMKRFARLFDVPLPVTFDYAKALGAQKIEREPFGLFAPESSSHWRSITNADAIEAALSRDYVRVSQKGFGWEALSLRELIDTVYSASHVISVDSGVAHLAGAMGIPLTVIGGFTDVIAYYSQYKFYNGERWSFTPIQSEWPECNSPCHGQADRGFKKQKCCGQYGEPQCLKISPVTLL